MKAIEALWAIVPNKGLILYIICAVCIIMSLVGGSVAYFALTVPVWGGEVAAVAFHNHAKRETVFNTKSIEAITSMVAINGDRQEVVLNNLRTALRSHNHLLYSPNVRGKNGKFVNKDVKIMWETQFKEIEKEINRLERKINGQRSEFGKLMLVASRPR